MTAFWLIKVNEFSLNISKVLLDLLVFLWFFQQKSANQNHLLVENDWAFVHNFILTLLVDYLLFCLWIGVLWLFYICLNETGNIGYVSMKYKLCTFLNNNNKSFLLNPFLFRCLLNISCKNFFLFLIKLR